MLAGRGGALGCAQPKVARSSVHARWEIARSSVHARWEIPHGRSVCHFIEVATVFILITASP